MTKVVALVARWVDLMDAMWVAVMVVEWVVESVDLMAVRKAAMKEPWLGARSAVPMVALLVVDWVVMMVASLVDVRVVQ